MDYSLELPREMTHRGSYFESTPELDSSTSSSPDPVADMFQYGSTTSTLFPPDQIWDAIDLESFDAFEGFEQPSKAPGSVVSATDSEKATVPTSKLRRRAQNRASQRAFRERKEKHVKALEHQLETLNEKHQDLLQSYTKQVDNIVKLNKKLAQLQDQLRALKSPSSAAQQQQTPHPHFPNPHIAIPDSFDAFSSTSDPGTMLYDGNTLAFDELDELNPTGSTSRTKKSLPRFEDLLRMA